MFVNDRHEVHKEVVGNLTKLILYHLSLAADQQYNPSSDADRMDAEIADASEKVAGLRKIREDFENLVTGIILLRQ
jgi:hypothetical protein